MMRAPIFLACISGLLFPLGPPAARSSDSDDGFKQIELLTEVMETIRQGYVDPEKVTYEQLINSALKGMLADLDPHCSFMQPQAFDKLRQSTDSTYEGIGVTISTANETLSIVTTREDGPAARAGVLPGDHIVQINGDLTEEIGIDEAVDRLRGKPGEPISMTIRRISTQELLEFELTREVIKRDSVKDVRILQTSVTAPYRIGYARILQFSEPTAEELADGLDRLEREGMDAFILDLRNNPGGLLGSAIDVCGEFVEAGKVVLTTEGKPGSGKMSIYRTRADRKRRDRDYPLAILVNHSSASGAEVVSGALQDLKRCIVVGETTFGKGSVQSILPIGDGKAIRMTTAKYYTPSHRTIHENGVIPNIVATLTPAQEAMLLDWFNRENLSPENRREVEKFRDPQLIRAIDAVKGALIYSQVQAGESLAPSEAPTDDAATAEAIADSGQTAAEMKEETTDSPDEEEEAETNPEEGAGEESEAAPPSDSAPVIE
ncbi:MAG: S41 family peptidase [Verrucomicrobiota bacterium]